MISDELDNPVWASLCGRHSKLSIREGNVARYQRDCAPFLGASTVDADVGTDLESIVNPGEKMLLLGIPPRIERGWQIRALEPLVQLVCEGLAEPIDTTDIVALDAASRSDVSALVSLIYPDYFRPRTMELGEYFGIYQGQVLAASIGERLATTIGTEISTVCTHPEFTGRGYARRLVVFLTNRILAQDRLPFLHVSGENEHAKSAYEKVGFKPRRNLAYWSLERG